MTIRPRRVLTLSEVYLYVLSRSVHHWVKNGKKCKYVSGSAWLRQIKSLIIFFYSIRVALLKQKLSLVQHLLLASPFFMDFGDAHCWIHSVSTIWYLQGIYIIIYECDFLYPTFQMSTLFCPCVYFWKQMSTVFCPCVYFWDKMSTLFCPCVYF